MDALTFGGMPRRLYSCTPSRLNGWLDCPRRFRMTYLDRPRPPKGPPWAHNSVGASVHTALAGWWRLPQARRTRAAAGDLLEQGWLTEGFRDERQCASSRRRWRELVESYVGHLDPEAEPVGVERTVGMRTDRIAVSGRVDRLDAPGSGDELVVVDYKTGRRGPDHDDVRSSMALALYALAAERTLRRRCRRVELHHLPTDTVVQWEHSDEGLARHLRRVESLAGEAAEAEAAHADGLTPAELERTFPPRPGPQCGWCDLSRHCPEGSRQYPARRGWEGLPEPA